MHQKRKTTLRYNVVKTKQENRACPVQRSSLNFKKCSANVMSVTWNRPSAKIQKIAHFRTGLEFTLSETAIIFLGSLKQQGTRIHQFLPIIGFQDRTNYCQTCLTPISVFLALIRSRRLAVVHREPCKPLNTTFTLFKVTRTLQIIPEFRRKQAEFAMLKSC